MITNLCSYWVVILYWLYVIILSKASYSFIHVFCGSYVLSILRYLFSFSTSLTLDLLSAQPAIYCYHSHVTRYYLCTSQKWDPNKQRIKSQTMFLNINVSSCQLFSAASTLKTVWLKRNLKPLQMFEHLMLFFSFPFFLGTFNI